MRETIVVCMAALLSAGCVTTKAYDAKVAELTQLRADDAKSAAAQPAHRDRATAQSVGLATDG
jgi:hypothetical protein